LMFLRSNQIKRGDKPVKIIGRRRDTLSVIIR